MTEPREDDATADVSGMPKRTLRVYPAVDVKMAKQHRAMERAEQERRERESVERGELLARGKIDRAEANRRRREGRERACADASPPVPDEDWLSHYWDAIVEELKSDGTKEWPVRQFSTPGCAPLPFPVKIRIGMFPGGRLGCTGLILGDDETEITARGLRRIGLPDIIAAAAEAYERGGGSVSRGFAHSLFGYDVGDAIPKPRVRPGRHGYGREFFEGQELPRFYEHALKTHPKRPAGQVARDLHITERVAYRWIKRAKALGLLQDPPARERSTSPPRQGGST